MTNNEAVHAAGQSITEQLVAAVAAVWRGIQDRHPEVPDVVLTLGSGTMNQRGRERFGHFAAGRWQLGDTTVDEFFLGGEGLRRGTSPVLGTLLHEATHGLAHVRGIKDTSRQGRYHNKQFKALAESLDLVIEHDAKIGWSVTQVPPWTEVEYAAELAQLEHAITVFRHAETEKTRGKPRNNNYLKATCRCPRVIRVAKAVFAEAPILCGACEHIFVAEESDDED